MIKEYCCSEGKRWEDETGGHGNDHPNQCIMADDKIKVLALSMRISKKDK